MTIEDAVKAMGVIEAQNNGTEARAVLVEKLNQRLIENPESFWDYYLAVLDAAGPNSYRDLAERLLRSGAVDERTTLTELPASMRLGLMRWRNNW